MSAGQDLKTLALRKQLLIAQNAAHRLLIRHECQRLRSTLNWLGMAREVGRAVRPYGLPLGAAAGLLFTWRRSFLLRWTMRGLAVWRLARTFLRS